MGCILTDGKGVGREVFVNVSPPDIVLDIIGDSTTKGAEGDFVGMGSCVQSSKLIDITSSS